jgi:hypothetical protein
MPQTWPYSYNVLLDNALFKVILIVPVVIRLLILLNLVSIPTERQWLFFTETPWFQFAPIEY